MFSSESLLALPLGVLRSPASSLKAVLLAFLDSGIPRHQAVASQGGLEAGVVHYQGPRYPVADCFCLRIHSSASDLGHKLKAICGICHPEWFVDDDLPRQPVKVFLHELAIDQHGPIFCGGVESYAGDGGFPLARAIKVLLLSIGLHQS